QDPPQRRHPPRRHPTRPRPLDDQRAPPLNPAQRRQRSHEHPQQQRRRLPRRPTTHLPATKHPGDVRRRTRRSRATRTRHEGGNRMTPTQAVAFVEKMKAAAPHINFEWDTPKAWAAALADIDWDEAHAALLTAIRKTPWITPAVIQDEVRAMRAEKLKHYIVPPPPNPDDVVGYLHALRAAPRAALRAAATSPLSLESGLD